MIIRKIGGSLLESPKSIKLVAEFIASEASKGKPQVIVISAMKGQTNQLIQLASEVSPSPSQRELDMLISTGERVSMSLLTMALIDLGVPAISFTGSQAGGLTKGPHSDSSISQIKPIRVEEEIAKGRVVVLAGFQGVDPDTKEITTLGRGGSDTTAIAMAAYFKAENCYIMKDVSGLYSANPKLVATAQPITQTSVPLLLEMCQAGAQVLHTKALQFLRSHFTPVTICTLGSGHPETQILQKTQAPQFCLSQAQNKTYLTTNCSQLSSHIESIGWTKASDYQWQTAKILNPAQLTEVHDQAMSLVMR